MKTVFKAGQKVYDQVHYPDCEGKVIKVYEDSILVIFEGVENYYSLDGRSGDSLITLSTKPYKVEFPGFEQKSSVPTIDEASKWLRETEQYTCTMRNSIVIYFTKKENYDVFESLRKLTILRDYYNEGWEPDWNDDSEPKAVIFTEKGKLECNEFFTSKEILAFKTPEIRDKFFKEQKELLETAKPLL